MSGCFTDPTAPPLIAGVKMEEVLAENVAESYVELSSAANTEDEWLQMSLKSVSLLDSVLCKGR